MEKFLIKYHPVRIEDIEECSNGSVDLFLKGELSEEHMERLVRFAATNSQIKKHGLAPLPIISTTGEEDNSLFRINEDKIEESFIMPEECKEIGLTEQEYSVLKGDYGTILGISVNKIVYRALLRKCRSKRALTLRKSEARAKTFMVKKMKLLAASHIKKKQRKEIMASIGALARPKNSVMLFR
jgi:hypothetical protein